mgnify:CR=1 FL=1
MAHDAGILQQALDIEVRRIEHAWAGLRTFTPDGGLAIGWDGAAEGFFWCVGQGGYGIQTAPAAGRLAADLIAGRDPGEAAAVLPRISPLALVGLLYTIVLLFSLQGDQILSRPLTVATVALPLLCYFVGMFAVALVVAKLSGMDYAQSASVAFTAAGNNFELAIAVAIGTFGATSAQALAGTIGPLIEIPVLVGLVYIMRGIGPRLFPADPTLPTSRSLT